jgi:hypothetical protein
LSRRFCNAPQGFLGTRKIPVSTESVDKFVDSVLQSVRSPHEIMAGIGVVKIYTL